MFLIVELSTEEINRTTVTSSNERVSVARARETEFIKTQQTRSTPTAAVLSISFQSHRRRPDTRTSTATTATGEMSRRF